MKEPKNETVDTVAMIATIHKGAQALWIEEHTSEIVKSDHLGRRHIVKQRPSLIDGQGIEAIAKTRPAEAYERGRQVEEHEVEVQAKRDKQRAEQAAYERSMTLIRHRCSICGEVSETTRMRSLRESGNADGHVQACEACALVAAYERQRTYATPDRVKAVRRTLGL